MHIPSALDPIQAVRQAFPNGLRGTHQFAGETTLIVDPAEFVSVARFLRDTPGLVYNFLSDVSAVDYYDPARGYGDYGERPERFAVSYHLYSMLYNRRLRVKVFVNEESASMPSGTAVWPAANWLEREIFDMMGIRFEGHPDLRRVLMPADWDGHPHRRDYPVGYETPMFSFNVEDIARHKPFAKE